MDAKLNEYFSKYPFGEDRKDFPTSQYPDDDVYMAISNIVDSLKASLRIKQNEKFLRLLNILEWRKKTLNFLNSGKFFRDINASWSEKDFEKLLTMSTSLTEPEGYSKNALNIEEYIRFEQLLEVFWRFEGKFKEKIGSVDFNEPYDPSFKSSSKGNSHHHTRSRMRTRRKKISPSNKDNPSSKVDSNEEDSEKKILFSDIKKLLKYFESSLSVIKDRSRYYVELKYLFNSIQPLKAQYDIYLNKLKLIKTNYIKYKTKYNNFINFKYNWNNQYLKLNSYLILEINNHIEQLSLEKVKFNINEIIQIIQIFTWFQKYKKIFKPYIKVKDDGNITENYGGEILIDLSNISSKSYGLIKKLIHEALKNVPLELEKQYHDPNNYTSLDSLTTADVQEKKKSQLCLKVDKKKAKEQSKVKVKNIQLPYTTESKVKVTVLNIGKISLKESYHTEKYIFPIGYQSKVRYMGEMYLNKIVYSPKGKGVEFQVSKENEPEKKYISNTISTLYQQITEEVGKGRVDEVDSYELFGFKDQTVKRLIECLEDSEKCSKYIFVDQREDKKEVPGPVKENKRVVEKLFYKDEELALLYALKSAVAKESSSKQKLLDLLGISEESTELPNLLSPEFAKNAQIYLSDAENILSQDEVERIELLCQLSAYAKKLSKNWTAYEACEIKSKETSLKFFKNIAKYTGKLVEKGLRSLEVTKLRKGRSILDVGRIDDIPKYFNSLIGLLIKYTEFIKSSTDLSVNEWIEKWRKNLKRKWFKIDVEGKLRLALCTYYIHDDEFHYHDCFLDRESNYCLYSHIFYPGGVGFMEKGDDILFYTSAEYTLTSKENQNGLNDQSTELDQENHAQIATSELLKKDIIVYVFDNDQHRGIGYLATIDTYFPKDEDKYEIVYEIDKCYETVKLYKDGILESYQSKNKALIGVLYAWRFATGRESNTLRSVRKHKVKKEIKAELDAYEDEIRPFEDDIFADPDFKPSLNDALENLRDYNLPGPRAQAPNMDLKSKYKIDYDSCKLYTYSNKLFNSLDFWFRSTAEYRQISRFQSSQANSHLLQRKVDCTSDRNKARNFFKNRLLKLTKTQTETKERVEENSSSFREEDVNALAIEIEQEIYDYVVGDKHYKKVYELYKKKVKNLAGGLFRNKIILTKVLEKIMTCKQFVRLKDEELISDEIKRKRKSVQQVLDQDRFIVKPSEATITKLKKEEVKEEKSHDKNDKADEQKVDPFVRVVREEPEVEKKEISEKTNNGTEKERKEEKLEKEKEVEEKEVETEKDIERDISLPIKRRQDKINSSLSVNEKNKKRVINEEYLKIITEVDIHEERLQKGDKPIDYNSLVRELKPCLAWKGLFKFPISISISPPNSTSTSRPSTALFTPGPSNTIIKHVSAEAELKIIDLPSVFITSNLHKTLQSHFFSILPSILIQQDQHLLASKTKLKDLKRYLDKTLRNFNNQIIFLATLKCEQLIKNYDVHWRKKYKVGTINYVEGCGFEMWIIPPFYNEYERLPKVIQNLPFPFRRKTICVFHLRRDNALKPIHHVMGSLPSQEAEEGDDGEVEEIDISDFTSRYDFQELVERAYDEETGQISKLTLFRRRNDDLEEVVKAPILKRQESDSSVTSSPQKHSHIKVDQQVQRETNVVDEQPFQLKDGKEAVKLYKRKRAF